MNFKKAFTPKDTEEIKPGFFIQKTGKGYRQVQPIVWNGEWRLKNQFGFKNLFVIALVLFIAWSYQHDVQEYKTFYEDIHSNPYKFCLELNEIMSTDICTLNYENMGLCTRQEKYKNIDISQFEFAQNKLSE